jgi:ankyrin repeat protein
LADDNILILEFLLSRGANPNQIDWTGSHPLHLFRTRQALDLLIDYGADIKGSCLLHSLIHNPEDAICIDLMDFAIGKGIDINAPLNPPRVYVAPKWRKKNRSTALHLAVTGESFSHIPRVKWLLDHGADPLIEDKAGRTAIDDARSIRDEEMVDLLLSYSSNDSQVMSV